MMIINCRKLELETLIILSCSFKLSKFNPRCVDDDGGMVRERTIVEVDLTLNKGEFLWTCLNGVSKFILADTLGRKGTCMFLKLKFTPLLPPLPTHFRIFRLWLHTIKILMLFSWFLRQMSARLLRRFVVSLCSPKWALWNVVLNIVGFFNRFRLAHIDMIEFSFHVNSENGDVCGSNPTVPGGFGLRRNLISSEVKLCLFAGFCVAFWWSASTGKIFHPMRWPQIRCTWPQ